ncbi:hypothetical protein HOLleu_42105 [Holothuria leucospilota]|uniref:DDE Tnp4 domain-containing protein n=1 Tax=Holothuria leucospilota TaxID=206669 RepID=A0A9Q0YCY8_HOLLE|nr:hypothetical protein HOLleu_42105 [Holothuria leucospilota]
MNCPRPTEASVLIMNLQLCLTFRVIFLKFQVCSIHFEDGRPTINHPYPTLVMGYQPYAACIIDCTEIYIQRPKNLKKRAQTYSNYKSHNTYKALYCIAPNGFVMYVSKLFGGRASVYYVFISHNSGFGSHLLPGDEVLADRGFTIENILPVGVKLSIPAFTKGNKDRCLPEENVASTRRIANVRIHVERAIRRLKCFKILANVIPCRIKNVDILIVCAGLSNLQPCLINDEVCTAADDIAGSELRDDDDSDLDNLACMYDSEA